MPKHHPNAGNRPLFDVAYDSPIGPLGITLQGGSLLGITLLEQDLPIASCPAGQAQRVLDQLDRYFTDGRHRFNLPLDPTGTLFQRRVWRVLSILMPGQVIRYGQVAQRLRTSARAVGSACRANPIPIVIPCHRVVGANGIGGFMGDPQRVFLKRWLLLHEGAVWTD
ncbi:MAG: methylated-DNA--[protein]-cysteine S-methyltransferase [Gammaproteobacteria bacterium]|nr:methylated-DNA--[protein]-cysteine S-methyltransferase [Gammaproteobacteria bacterium]